MSARRLLMAGGGGGSFAVTVPDRLVELTTTPDGGWSEPQRSKIVRYGDHAYIGWVAGTSGDVKVGVVDLTDLSIATTTTLHAALGGEGTADMHDDPALIVRDSDHRLLAFYCAHADSTIRLRISTNTLDADPTIAGGFASEVSLHSQIGSSVYDYPAVFQLLGETNDPLYLFHRSSNSGTSRWRFSTSTDGGVTWTAYKHLYTNSGFEPYMQFQSNGTDRIDFIGQNKNEGEVTDNEVRHGYIEGGVVYKSDGTSAGTLPLGAALGPSDLTLAADSAGYHLFGLERYAGEVAFTVSARISGSHYVYRVLWNGSTWAKEQIATSPGTGGLGSGPYSWGNVIDPTDFTHAIVSRWVSGVAELWEYQRDGGGTWTGTSLSGPTGLTDDFIWPIFLADSDYRLRAMVLYGTYTGYINSQFLLGIYLIR